jgi:hypothetical protein
MFFQLDKHIYLSDLSLYLYSVLHMYGVYIRSYIMDTIIFGITAIILLIDFLSYINIIRIPTHPLDKKLIFDNKLICLMHDIIC